MDSSKSLSPSQTETSILLNKNRSLLAMGFGLVAIVLSYLLGQAHTTDDFVTQYIIATIAIYAVFTPFSALR